ncbi:glycoside hydrolase family 2 protein [Bosea sp. (in: a-proteobacteria)]|uniref:glycoside hydrolase family 2 protein n=1 Tax=Bosea sp. (in: a-proteobacteria) TaxID=1871050 RepID=UPI00273574A0|nr:glycoside hydrolase family 2 TIM barrel-domain containing protein [Bosea sp. (in: a-proteobacteria)]MDP3256212.1 glycoside hydrolase family 2 TIM barrel-domain containing protein [Bosea sp. (in: a-proteobacteria)]
MDAKVEMIAAGGDGGLVLQPGHDPYHHLHDEAYAAPFSEGRVGWRDLISVAGRRLESLDGTWNFVLDMHDEGLRQRWFEDAPDPIGGWTTPRDYDDGAWQTTTVPSCWNVMRPEWTYFEGGAWYTREVAFAPGRAGERVFLRVGAANYEARVFLNGVFIGSHRGGSTPFFIELTGHLAAGANRLQINVDNRRRPERVPMNHTDWFNYGGLYREVGLLRVPAVFIRDFGVALVPGSQGRRIAVDVTLSGPASGTARLRIDGLAEDVAIPVSEGVGRIEFDAAPELWSPARPKLYPVRLSFGEDEVADSVGFREIRVEGQRILLNGEDIFLRGICVHEDDRDLGKVSTEADIRRRFADAKALNANFLRLSHYPHHELAARIADEVGLLLWEEVPVYWAIDFANPDTFADADNQLREMIRRDRNRASIVIWGVGNENADTDARLAFMSGLAASCREMDPTRLVSAACLINREHFRVEDRLSEALDVIGLNEYFGWYEPSLDGLKRLFANSDLDKPLVITETGADAVAGREGRPGELFGETHQADLYERQLDLVESAPYVRGFCPWILYDFRTERRQTAYQRGWNLKGLIAADKTTRKKAFTTLSERYSELAQQQTPAGA